MKLVSTIRARLRTRKRKPQPTYSEAMAMRPVKNIEVEETISEDGTALIAYPVRLRPVVSMIARRLGKAPPSLPKRRIRLDGPGSEVWNLINGERSVSEIAAAFRRRYNADPKETEIAVSRFLRDLGRRGLIGLK
jgi:hypothetical protein